MNITYKTAIRADVFITRVGTPEQIKTCLDDILVYRNKLIEDSIQFDEATPGHWRVDSPIPLPSWLKEGVEDMTNNISNIYCKIDPTFADIYKSNTNKISNWWLNINELGLDVPIHSHSKHKFIACYYVQTTNTGDIKFFNPANVLKEANGKSPFISGYLHSPKDGELLMWPAWVPHYVMPSTIDKKRICLTFTID